MKLFLLVFLVSQIFLVVNASEKKRDDTFYIALDREQSSLNPYTQAGFVNFFIDIRVMDRLFEPSPYTWDEEPCLAESYKPDFKNSTLTVKIRPNAVWSDGKKITSDDVVFSYTSIKDLEYKATSVDLYDVIKKVEKVDDTNVRFHFVPGQYIMLMDVLKRIYSIYPKHFYADKTQSSQWSKAKLGSGPYVVESFVPGQQIILKRNPLWWGNRLANYQNRYNFPRIHIRFVKDPVTQTELMKRGDLDWVQTSDTMQFHEFEEAAKKTNSPFIAVKTDKNKGLGFLVLSLNHRRPFFKDIRVRKALLYLFNRDEAAVKLLNGYVKTAARATNSNLLSDPRPVPLEYDPIKAVKLFKEAGWEDTDKDGYLDKIIDGHKTKFAFTIYSAYPKFEKILVAYQEAAKKMGIDVSIQRTDFLQLMKLQDEHKIDASIFYARWSYLSYTVMGTLHSSKSMKESFSGYSHPKLDRLIEQAQATQDKIQMKKIIRQISDFEAEEQVELPLFEDKYLMYAVSKRIVRPFNALPFNFGIDYWSLK